MSPAALSSLQRRAAESVLIGQWNFANTTLQVWVTPCIVTRFGKSKKVQEQQDNSNRTQTDTSLHHRHILVNPSNSQLSGVSKFSYFPRGGPVPVESLDALTSSFSSSQWGGMEAGEHMMYPVQVVDGLVHQLGGRKLRAAIAESIQHQRGNKHPHGIPCPPGSAVLTPEADETLSRHYDAVVHTTPPFYSNTRQHDHSANNYTEVEDPPVCLSRTLQSCYSAALSMAFSKQASPSLRTLPLCVAIPLLGSGCCNFPYDISCQIAARTTVDWTLRHNRQHQGEDGTKDGQRSTIAFGLLEETIARQLCERIQMETERNDVSMITNSSL